MLSLWVKLGFSEGMRIYSDSKVCRFLKSVTQEQIIGFLNDWNKKRDHKQCIYISYDSTNKNCQAGDIDIIEYGKAKDDKGLPVFNLAIAFDQTNRVPLFYEEYPGSITDVSQFEYMVNKVKDYQYKSVGFILDRGYFSKANIKYMEDNGYSFIMMVKGCKSLVSELITTHRNTFETDRECAIRSYRVYGKTVLAKLYEDDVANRYFHLYFNTSKQAAEREQLEHLIERLGMYLEKHVGKDITLGSLYHEYFDLRYNKKHELISYTEKKDVIKKRLEQCGYFSIITSTEMTASQALIHYKGRDISEKLFSTDKSFIGSKSNRVQSSESLSAKLFIEFIALIVRNRIYNLLKETMMRLESKPNYMTVPAALRELEKIEMVRRSKDHYRLDHAITKRQKVILSSFGMDENNIREIACTIGNLLSKNQSLSANTNIMDEEENDDGTDEIDIFD
jgi:transposase